MQNIRHVKTVKFKKIGKIYVKKGFIGEKVT